MKRRLLTATFMSFGLIACDGSAILNAISGEPATATTIGFDPVPNYPSRDQSYDGYLPELPELSQAQLRHFFNDIAMPQSEGAIVGLLGWPTSYDGVYQYWRIEGGSSELAIKIENGRATTYTVGY